jgi:hypothetical protein
MTFPDWTLSQWGYAIGGALTFLGFGTMAGSPATSETRKTGTNTWQTTYHPAYKPSANIQIVSLYMFAIGLVILAAACGPNWLLGFLDL